MVAVFGCSICLVLRPREGRDRFELLGGAYVHGGMQGETVRGRDPATADVFQMC
ncbi:hypothetical protein B0H63DRAFT_457893 [Podospora didyma]|uniref:Uncharacterized protein n=1 Tax=Podospora didyma TaxID=330526 RepID=A0AAE0P4P6_9PEZI|nr:hypothetical protein B0H63DRAFT_457893 [Podospora didyma]